jgi:hypothetical protein
LGDVSQHEREEGTPASVWFGMFCPPESSGRST